MYEPFGFGFYEWWAGLGRGWHWTIALATLKAGGILAWLLPGSWHFWLPVLVTGGVLVIPVLRID